MVRALRKALAALLVLWSTHVPAQPMQIMGYLGWWLPDAWRHLPLNEIDRLHFFELAVQADGTIPQRHGWPDAWSSLQEAAQRNGTAIDLALTLFRIQDFNVLFGSDAHTANFMATCRELLNHPAVGGLQLDFELEGGWNPEAHTRFQAFVVSLSEEARNRLPAKQLSVFYQTQYNPNLYSVDALRRLDFMVLQGYDTHFGGSKRAGPVAPLRGSDVLTWESAWAHTQGIGIDPAKLIYGFPLYGYEWRTRSGQSRADATEGSTVTFARVSEWLLPDILSSVTARVQTAGGTLDPATGSSYYLVKDGKNWVVGWYEDWWSLSQKIEFLTRNQAGGISFFLLGYDAGQLVRHAIHQRGPRTMDSFLERWTDHRPFVPATPAPPLANRAGK